MLDQAGVTPAMSWEEAMRLVINQPAYRTVKTLAERKAIFSEWKAAKQSEASEGRRRDERQRKIDFVSMLKGCDELSSRSRFSRVSALFEADPRWARVEDELEREELFEEYVLSLERKELADRRAKRTEHMAAFRAVLLASGITVTSSWRRVQVWQWDTRTHAAASPSPCASASHPHELDSRRRACRASSTASRPSATSRRSTASPSSRRSLPDPAVLSTPSFLGTFHEPP